MSTCVAFVTLESDAKDTREAEHRRVSKELLELLHLVSRHEDLVSGSEIGGVGSRALVNVRKVHLNLSKRAGLLAPQYDDFALVARAQHAACFSNRLGDGHAVIHQTNAWLAHVANNTVTI